MSTTLNFLPCNVEIAPNLARHPKSFRSYLFQRRCPWNSGCNCLQRSLYQPRRDWRQNANNKEGVKQGQTWLAATFEKWYTQTSVGLHFFVCPASILAWCRRRRKDAQKTHRVNKRTHTRANTRPAAPSLEDTITPPSRLFMPTSLFRSLSLLSLFPWSAQGCPHL